MGKYDWRNNYEKLFKRLLFECHEPLEDMEKYSDYQLLQLINKRLKRLNCTTYTLKEMDEIGSNMN